MNETYPHKCSCGAMLDSRMEYLDHDCNAWEWVLEEERKVNEFRI